MTCNGLRSSVAQDNADLGGWSFLQSLANNIDKDDKVYNPPNFRRSSSMLSERSLEMCTESLGSETGNDGSESSDEMGSRISLENVKRETPKSLSKSREIKRMINTTRFPPPLTSISSFSSFKVRPRREGGRLVLEAVNISCQAYFHAERSDGRLRLSPYDDCSANSDQDDGEEEAGAEAEAEDENGGNCEGKMEKLTRPRTCKGNGCGNKSLLDWEAFMVTT